MADVNGYFKTARTGGTVNSIDGVDGNILNDGDVALCFVAGTLFVYSLDVDSAAADDGVNVIAPDANAGDKRWLLQEIVGKNLDDFWIPASAMTPTATSGAYRLNYEYATNHINLDYLAFDGASEEFAEFGVVMPARWDRGTIKAKVYWAPGDPACSPGDKVEWKLAAGAFSDDDAIDAALGGAQVIFDTVLAGKEGVLHISSATPAITIGGTPALGDLIHFKISRNVASANDDMTEDAWLFGVMIQFSTNQSITAW